MPPNHRAVLVEESSAGFPRIEAVPTAVAAFVGSAEAGVPNEPVEVSSFVEYQQTFGTGEGGGTLAASVAAFFGNGGTRAVIVRVPTKNARLTSSNLIGRQTRAEQRGIFALEKSARFNLLCIPPFARGGSVPITVLRAAAAFCERHRAILLIDAPAKWVSVAHAKAGFAALRIHSPNAALYFPQARAEAPGPKVGSRPITGAVAGMIARNDGKRGVWKSPAGSDAQLTGFSHLAVELSELNAGELSDVGVNCLRSFNGKPHVWGARTLAGSESEWKYLAIRRLALHLDESIDEGTKWAVFEPDSDSLWESVRLSVETFLDVYFRAGAFAGDTARDAYFVRVDPAGAAGVARRLVLAGFAPIKAGEFVLLRFFR